jgi:hypothetical protein
VFDLAGNVTEWVFDSDKSVEWTMGGSYSSSAEACKIGFERSPPPPKSKPDSVGFRVVLHP